jgi:hypothetical protein
MHGNWYSAIRNWYDTVKYDLQKVNRKISKDMKNIFRILEMFQNLYVKSNKSIKYEIIKCFIVIIIFINNSHLYAVIFFLSREKSLVREIKYVTCFLATLIHIGEQKRNTLLGRRANRYCCSPVCLYIRVMRSRYCEKLRSPGLITDAYVSR